MDNRSLPFKLGPHGLVVRIAVLVGYIPTGAVANCMFSCSELGLELQRDSKAC